MVTVATYATGAQLDIGRVISRTFGALGTNFLTFFLLALLFGGLPTVAVEYAAETWVTPWLMSDVTTSSYFWKYLLLQLGSSAVLLLPTYVLIGALTHGSVVHLNGGRASFAECLGTGLSRGLPLIALGLLTTMGLYLFTLLLIIPGIMAATRWAVAAPALVVERTGVMGAFGRSHDLARDNRWRIFWLFVIWMVVSLLIVYAIQNATVFLVASVESLGDATLWVYYGILALYTALTNMIGATGSAALYSELRTIKEGATSEELAKVFD